MQIGASHVWLSLCKGLSKSERESVVVRVPLAGWLVKVNSLQVLFNSSSPLDQWIFCNTPSTMDTLWLEIQSTLNEILALSLESWLLYSGNKIYNSGGLRLTPDPACYFSNFQETWSSLCSADDSGCYPLTSKLMIGVFLETNINSELSDLRSYHVYHINYQFS